MPENRLQHVRRPPVEAVIFWSLWLLMFFLPAELYAAFFTRDKADTFSEFCWWVFNAWWKRASVGLLLFVLAGHLIWQWSAIPVMVFGAAVAWSILDALRRYFRVSR